MAKEDLGKVDALVKRVEAVQQPWVGEKEGKLLLGKAAVSALEAAVELTVEVEPVLQAASATLSERIQEARKLPNSAEALEELAGMRKRVDEVNVMLTQLKVDTSHRQTAQQVPNEMQRVADAQRELQSVLAVTAPLAEDVL